MQQKILLCPYCLFDLVVFLSEVKIKYKKLYLTRPVRCLQCKSCLDIDRFFWTPNDLAEVWSPHIIKGN